MYKKEKYLAVIPARGESKGLPGKNIKDLCGKPLIAWTIERSLKSKYIDRTIVSTDSKSIASISEEYGAEIPFLRPAEFATDTSTTFSVIKHAIEHFADNEQQIFDYIIILQPTSPLREIDDIDKMIEKLAASAQDFDSIISVGEVSEHPAIIKKLENDFVLPYCVDLPITTRRQDNTPAYFPYGIAYITKVSSFLEERTIYTKRCTYFKIKRYQNYDIDDIYDFLCTEQIMKYEWFK